MNPGLIAPIVRSANLNKSYFTNRQDRYLHFTSQSTLTQYCFDFLQTVSTFSYKLLPSDTSTSLPTPNPHSYTREDYRLEWPDPETHPHYIHKKAEAALTTLQASYREAQTSLAITENSQPASSLKSVLLFPVIQAGQFNIREEETTLQSLFYHLDLTAPPKSPPGEKPRPRPLLDLTSGYFGLYKPYQDLILASGNVDSRIVAASPKVDCPFIDRPLVHSAPPSGKWILWLERGFRPDTRGIHFIRAAVHASRERSRPIMVWRPRRPTQRMGERGLDIPR